MATEPPAREFHAALGIGQNMLNMFICAGSGYGVESSVVHKFNLASTSWQEPRRLINRTLPDGYYGMAVASDGENSYLFGGFVGPLGSEQSCNKIYKINISLECKELAPATSVAPTGRGYSGLVCANRSLISYGGYTGSIALNDLFVFDLHTDSWTAPVTTGENPPALQGHTLTSIDKNKAALFGGYGGSNRYNDTYVLDIDTKHWSKVKTSGKKPPARNYHATCVLKGHHTHLAVIGGYGGGSTVFSDMWLLDMTNESWTEVTLPAKVTERCGHSARVFGSGPDFRIIILFGGFNYKSRVISGTTLLLLSQKKGSWVVERVVNQAELRVPDNTLREQMNRLKLIEPLSDKRAQEIIDKALESGSLKMRNVISILTGLMGSGKTWLLSRLFHQLPPDLYTSTGVAEQSFRCLLHHIGNLSMDIWREFLPENILQFLACHFREELPPANILALAAQFTTAAVPESRATDIPLLSTPSTISTPAVTPPVLALPPRPLSPQESSTGQSMVRLVKAPMNTQILSMLELIHVIDTGGQPEYMEMMPHLIQSCHLAVLVLNLVFGLDECPPIQLHEKGIAYKRALPFQYTNRQVIQKLASTLQAKRFSRKKGQCFRLLVVATHKDCVKGDLAGKVGAMEQALNEILLPACNDELILFSANQIAFVLNLKDPGSDDIASLQLLREKIGDSEVGEIVEVPVSFLVFEQDLLQFAQKVGRDILSLDECLQVGVKLKMNAEVVGAALIFFQRQITLLYFQSVLPHLVFTKPQVPLDFINAVVKFSYKVNSGILKGCPANLASSLRDGIITEEILDHELLKKWFIPDLYEPVEWKRRLKSQPLSREPQFKEGIIQPEIPIPSKRKKREYLMMSVVPAVPDKDLCRHLPKASDVAPLLVKFTNDCVPLSCFSSAVSCLLSMYDWRLCRSEGGSPECLAHNVVSLYSPNLPVTIVLLDAANHIEIYIHAKKKIEQELLPDICTEVRDTVFAAIRDVFDTMQLTRIDVTSAFLCPCCTASESHSASVYTFRSKWFLRCSKTGASEGQAEDKHIIRLDTAEKDIKPSLDKPSPDKPSLDKPSQDKPSLEKPSLDKPSLLNLLPMKIHQRVGANYVEFGIYLLNDETGCRVNALEIECLGKPDRIVLKILQEWVSGKGVERSWVALIKILCKCELSVLAEQVEKQIQ